MYEKIVNLIIMQAEELNETLENKIPAELGASASLFDGKDGILDSIALVTLIVAVEQSVEDEFETSIILANEKAMSLKNSPFKTIGSLAEYIVILLNEENTNG
ncbi:MAG: acyl carrier protein [Candidatus Magnetomorum sp.]|nr:acyl carrier protein [Candidatus Magnetomorum sp.]